MQGLFYNIFHAIARIFGSREHLVLFLKL